jgi:hyaluronoglucosaminidase
MCNRHGINFTDNVTRFGIIQNTNDTFRGDKFDILYDPGKFPAILESSSGGLFLRNGGVPQEGSVREHMEVFVKHVNELIPDEHFNGKSVF